MRFNIRVAGVTIEINSLYLSISRRCAGYICDCAKKADISVRTTMEQLQYDHECLAAENDEATMFWSIECFAVHRQIAEAILLYDTFLIHGAVVAVDDSAYLFCAPSGTGKTTHLKLWLKNLPNAFAVNGDKPFLRIMGDKVLACGSPWCGKENLGTNTMVPLKAIIFMERSEHNQMQKVSFGNIFPNLLQQTYRPEEADGMKKTISLLRDLPGKVKFYRFHFNNFEDDAFRVAYDTLCANNAPSN